MFEWNGEQAKINDRKHGVSFYEAMTAFADPWSLTIRDPAHSMDEDRFVLLGISDQARLLVVVCSRLHADKLRSALAEIIASSSGYLLCIENSRYVASLELKKVSRQITDAVAQ